MMNGRPRRPSCRGEGQGQEQKFWTIKPRAGQAGTLFAEGPSCRLRETISEELGCPRPRAVED